MLATIDDPNAANYIGKLFYDAHGASATHNTTLKQTFDASHIFTSRGAAVMTGATVVWNFGDGKTGTGLVANHTYATQGDYTATATVTLSNGKIIELDKTLHVQNSAILDMDFNADAFDHSPTVNAVTLNTAKLVSTGDGGRALDVNGSEVKYKGNAGLLNNAEFSLVMDFKKDVGEENLGGRLVYLSGSYAISVGADAITAVVNTTAGSKTLTATKVGISDSDWHRIGVSFSGETGFLKLYLDGHEVASASGLVGGIQKGTVGADLYLGGAFGSSFGGLIDNFHLSDSAVDTLSFTTGILATPQSEFGSLAQFDNFSVSQSVHAAAAADVSALAHQVVETVPMVSLPHNHHFDFNWMS